MFRFRLSRLLSLKISHEQLLKIQLNALRNQIKDIETDLKGFEEQLRSLDLRTLSRSTRGVTGFELSQLLTYREILWREIESLKSKLDQLRKQEETLRDQYLEARKERKILQNLRERRFKAYAFEQDRLHRLYLDEVAIRKFTSSQQD
ncbi:flagellar export protein FliJ [Pseudothermotoga sp.]|nr:flagellar export protein FliJ [Pseudothermotoga sp.]MCX7813426.1 flagellar export protein FliJ [Pseudothermotoga sp.]MDW8139586.1 flagellar export protein FliJ [Pseudothermotoga sp.]